MHSIEYLFLVFYGLASLGLFLYGMNCYVMLFCFFRNRRTEERRNREFLRRFREELDPDDLPSVTTQLPIYNERFVIDRLLESVTAMEYPKEKHEIQVLDDSTDETRERVAELVAAYRRRGFRITHLTREDRAGFKAGALNQGLRVAGGDLLAVFDADFIPGRDFLLQTVPFFFEDPRIAMVQTRWGFVNQDYSLLTRAQSVGIDGHFVIEQGARTWQGLFMNFNGTAGIWRREAIIDAGGWQADTLTEDLDLSYRVQLRGWRMKYLQNVVTPSEIPVDINGLKAQQHRWAKGSIQTAIKILPRVFRARIGPFKKIEAAFHLTHYLIHPMMLAVALFALPALHLAVAPVSRPLFWITGAFLVLATFSPSILYLCSQRIAYRDWKRRILILPALVAIGIGIAVNNTRAVIEAILGRKSGFVRTPKHGVGGPGPAAVPSATSVVAAGSAAGGPASAFAAPAGAAAEALSGTARAPVGAAAGTRSDAGAAVGAISGAHTAAVSGARSGTTFEIPFGPSGETHAGPVVEAPARLAADACARPAGEAQAGTLLRAGPGGAAGVPVATRVPAASGAGKSAGVAAHLGHARRVYKISPRFSFVLELSLGAYGFWTVLKYGLAGKWGVLPFLFLNAAGFSAVGIYSLLHWWRSQPPERLSPTS